MSKVYFKDIGIRKSVCGKDSIPFYVNLNLHTQGVLVYIGVD